jgi:uncharacterized protein
MVNADTIRIEVVYALPEQAHLVPLCVNTGTTIRQAIEISGLLQQCPEIDLARNKVGIFSRLQSPETVLSAGDRVEIYRELRVDPIEARRRRLEKKKK